MAFKAENLSTEIDQAKADVVARLNILHDQVVLIKAELATWRDGSLGCPKPGMMYTQALVDGYRIELQVDKKIYHYHGKVGHKPFLCEK
ncbi:MAG: hypothetical protein AAF629_19285 [Chloroflexota bacterium]